MAASNVRTQPSRLNPNACPFYPAGRRSLPSSATTPRSDLNSQAFPFFPRSPAASIVTMLTINCRSIVNKTAELAFIAQTHTPGIICLTETWLCPAQQLSLQGYSCFRRDRTGQSGTTIRGYGGVAILINNVLFPRVRARPDLADQHIEALWLELGLPNEPPITICCVYRPPTTLKDETEHFCSVLTDTIQSLDLSATTLILTGDFNAANQAWCRSDRTTRAGTHVERMFLSFGMQQLVSFPTHHGPNSSACLDLIATNRPDLMHHVDFAAPLGASDHVILVCRLNIVPSVRANSSPTKSGYNFRKVPKTTWSSINHELQALNWDNLLSSPCLDTCIAVIDRELQYMFLKYLQPFRRVLRKSRAHPKSYPPWMTPTLLRAMKMKNDRHSLARKYPTPTNIQHYNLQRNLVRSLSRAAHRSYIQSITSSLSAPQRPTLHKFIRSQRLGSSETNIPPLQRPDNTVCDDPGEKATVLNNHFAAVCIPDDPSWSLPPTPSTARPQGDLSSFHTSAGHVAQVIKRLPTGKAPGLDGIPNDVLKALSPSLSYPLSLLFNQSFRSGVFPMCWKHALVVPIYKGKGQRSAPTNYRPISLLSSMSKLCEKIVYEQLYHHVSPALAPSQSGFRKGDSTSFQLVNILQRIAELRDQKCLTAMCFFDLAKAFDTVWFRGLLHKLEVLFNVRNLAFSWIASYLTGRTQSVRLNSSISDPLPVSSGVPQGSILGPLLFLIYVNDLPLVVPGISLFADDTGLLVSDSHVDGLVSSLQDGINSIISWMHSWHLKPNILKTEAIFFFNPLLQPRLTFPGSSDSISVVQQHKHLGIIIDVNLSWTAHIDYICRKSSSTLGVLAPHCSHLPVSCKKLFYKVYILPILMYACNSWCHLSATSQSALEIHHKKLLKILFRKPRLFPSSDLYLLCDTSPLAAKRRDALCLLIHQFRINVVPSHLSVHNWFNNSSRTRNKVILPKSNSSALINSPLFIAYSEWLKLPISVKQCTSLASFKHALNLHKPM